jgi:hypothetical protein
VGAAASASNPVSSVKYQKLLTGLDNELRRFIQGIGQASTPEDLSTALSGAATAVEKQNGILGRLTAPAIASGAHADLLTALRSLRNDLDGLASAASSRKICTGGTGTPRVSRASGADALRSAAKALDAAHPGAGFRVGAFLPARADDPIRRPENGDLVPGQRGGLGELKLSNARDFDAVVKLVSGGQVARQVYVRANSEITVGAVPDGAYETYVTTGYDWDAGRFTRDCTFKKFGSPSTFTTTATTYTIFTISLLRSPSLYASETNDVDPDAFPN